jgi:predicted helicase
VEVVDFIIRSVADVLKAEFGRSLGDEGVHILDPFTGTGTFMTRLLQSGLIGKDDLPRKYRTELHANEMVLLAYYIAAVNIENAYHDLMAPVIASGAKQSASEDEIAAKAASSLRSVASGKGPRNDAQGEATYEPFSGIILTDTFQLGESDVTDERVLAFLGDNSQRIIAQKKAPVRVIMGNPPYSIGQKSANDNAQNQAYPRLDSRIAATYALESTAGLNKSLYDAYIKAFRWSTDRLGKEGGIICFVSNGAWLSGNSTDGFRKVLAREFSSIHVFDLRGNQRTSGELSRKEGGKIFGSGSRTPIAITLLVKRPEAAGGQATIHYHDIGDYLTREKKLAIIKGFGSVRSRKMEWRQLTPNAEGDWLEQRSGTFAHFIALAPEKKFDVKSESFFIAQSLGTATNRDAWVYNFSIDTLKTSIQTTILHYNEERQAIANGARSEPKANSSLGTWTRDWMNQLKRNHEIKENSEEYRKTVYRPFVKIHSYFEDDLNQERYRLPQLFPARDSENLVICVTGVAASREFSALITDIIPNLDTIEKAQCFPLYWYEEQKPKKDSQGYYQGDLLKSEEKGFIRRDGISDFILRRARAQYGAKGIGKEDIFYYVYGLLHSRDYREAFAHDLKKMLPRLPLVEDVRHFWAFSKAGKELAALHVDYEKVTPSAVVTVTGVDPSPGPSPRGRGAAASGDTGVYRVQKMRFVKKGQKDTIEYNGRITVSGIPAEAYD